MDLPDKCTTGILSGRTYVRKVGAQYAMPRALAVRNVHRIFSAKDRETWLMGLNATADGGHGHGKTYRAPSGHNLEIYMKIQCPGALPQAILLGPFGAGRPDRRAT